MKKLFLFMTGGMLITSIASAHPTIIPMPSYNSSTTEQQQSIRGKVIDKKTGEPIIGATIKVKGTSKGTVSNINGAFKLDATPGQTLLVTYVGYKQTEVKASENMTIKIEEDTKSLDELVVVGYTTQKRESLTGAMQNIKSEKLKTITSPSVTNMLNSKVPGVYVAPGSGRPGSNGAIVIRGQASINGTTAPLWVIDGVIVGSNPGELNPEDVESMTILKDAASTAIYGSQGANGVIVVTTKSGIADKLKVGFSMRTGITRLNNGNLKMMNGAELYDYYQSFANANEIKFTRWNKDLRSSNFNWWDLATRTGLVNDYNLTIQGGNKTLKSYLSLGIYDETGAIKGYKFRRYSFMLKNIYTPYEWLSIKPSVSGSKQTTDDRQYSVGAMYSMLPWDSPYDKDGNLVPNRYSGWVNAAGTNYLNDLQWNHDEGTNYQLMGNLDFDIHFNSWLTFSSINNYRQHISMHHGYSDPRSEGGKSTKGRITENRYYNIRLYSNQKLMFNQSLNKHSINGVVATEFNSFEDNSVDAWGIGFLPGFEVLNVAAKPEKTKGYIREWAVMSYLMNLNYSYDNKYLAQISARRDGASNFGDNAKWGNFFSISGGWNINKEIWFNAPWIDQLKLRASYGSVGNRPSELYPQYDLYSVSGNYNGNPAALISQIGNKELTWEQTYTSGIGIDFSAFENRLRLTLDYYSKNTDNVLFKVPITGLVGVTSIWRNIGKMNNKGIELNLGGDIIKSEDYLWSVDLNISHNKNKLVDIYKQKNKEGEYEARPVIIGDGLNIAGSASRILKIGSPVDTYYIKKWAGVNTDDGSPQWYKKTDDGDITTSKYAEATNYEVGTSSPKLFGGINSAFKWKRLDANMTIGFSIGGHVYNYSRQEYDSDGAYTDRNQMALKKGWSRWKQKGDHATHPIAKYNNASGSNKSSSRYIEKNDFLKLRSLSIGYNFNLSKLGLNSMRVYLSGENLFTITPYSGVDPEIPPSDNGTVLGTTSPSVYPSTKKYVLGISLNL